MSVSNSNPEQATGVLDRPTSIAALEAQADPWDLIIIGGGATGVGIAVDAASRGYRTVLLEQHDFGKGTSTRSTKLAHGGVRYLAQGNVSLVLDALRERGLMKQNAPHLVHELAFILPNYDWWGGFYYGIGLRMYDVMAGKLGFGRCRNLSKKKTIEHLPTIEPKGLRGGVVYYDGQFDDARLVLNLAQTAAEKGAVLLNYTRVSRLVQDAGKVQGVVAVDQETGREYTIRGKVVINATGPFTDDVRHMDKADARPMITPSQGVHIVLDRKFLPSDYALMVPKTDDGRVLFAIPWHDCVVVGTTDTPIDGVSLEPKAQADELDFLLTHAARYLTMDPTPADVLSVFVGIRPLVKADKSSTAALSRDHTLQFSDSGLMTICGGKWTTYRKMAQDAVDHAAKHAGLAPRACVTKELRIHGYHENVKSLGDLQYYGSDSAGIQKLQQANPALAERLHPDRAYTAAEVVWSVRNEMARTVEDFLSRRTRALILGARLSVEMAPAVARIMAKELGKDEAWQTQQVSEYTALAQQYVMN